MLEYKPIYITGGKPVNIPEYSGFNAPVKVALYTPFDADEPAIIKIISDAFATLECPRGSPKELFETWKLAHASVGDSYNKIISIPYWLAEWAFYNEIDLPVSFVNSVALTSCPVSFRVKSSVYTVMDSMFRTKESLSLLAKSECRTVSRLPALLLMGAIPDWFGKKLNKDERAAIAIYKNRLDDVQNGVLMEEPDRLNRVISCYVPRWLSMRAAHSTAFDLSPTTTAIAGLLQAVCNSSLKLKRA